MYGGGIGVVQNYNEAYRWSRLAASAGQSSSQYNLGVSYENGLGVRKDSTRSYIWYSIAATASYSTCGLSGTSGFTEAANCATAAQARDRVAKLLSTEALERAQAIATRCFESNYQDCG